MIDKKAIHTTVLFRNGKVLTVVDEGRHYACPIDVNEFIGDLEAFKKEYPDHELPEGL